MREPSERAEGAEGAERAEVNEISEPGASGVTVGVVEESNSITGLEFVTYASFVLNFILAGALAVILFKKALKMAEARFAMSAKVLSAALGFLALYGFFTTYLYNSHLNDSIREAPVFLTISIWIFVGAAVGFVTRTLLARKEKPNRKAALIDAGIYGFIFLLAAFSVSSGIKTNAALLFALVAGFLMIVPLARSLSAYKVASARHKRLNEISEKILIYGLLIIPAVLPALSFAHVLGLSDTLTLLLINFITFDFVLVVALAMIASAEPADDVDEADEADAADAADASVARGSSESPVTAGVSSGDVTGAVGQGATAAQATVEQNDALTKETVPSTSERETPRAKPDKIAYGNPDDPIIQFLNSEEGGGSERSDPPRTDLRNPSRLEPDLVGKKGKPKIVPPKKPGKPGGSDSGAEKKSSAPNAPSRLKAPAKPKKRF